MKKIFLIIVSTLFFAPSAFAGKGYTADTQPATCVDGDFWIDTNGATGERFYVCEEGSWVKSVGYGTSANPSFNSVHASGGNLAAANAQVTKKWITGLSYTANVTSVIYGGKHYICTSTHTADSTTEPGVGASWATVWSEVVGGSGATYTAGTGIDITSGVISSTVTGTLPPGTEGQGVQKGATAWEAVDLAPLAFTDNVSRNSSTGVVSVPVTATATSGSSVPLTSGGAYTALGGKQDADADLNTAAGATGAGNSKYFGTNSGGTAGFYDLPSGGGVGGYVTAPVYSDSTCTAGAYSFHATYGVVYCKATNTWDYQVVSGTSLVWASWNNLTPTSVTLTVDGTGWNGTTDTISANSTGLTADGTIAVPISATVPVTCTPGSGRSCICTGDYLTGASSPFNLDSLSGGSTIYCTFSAIGISDDFSTDTSANYTAIAGSMTISSGVAHGQSWLRSFVYNETDTGSNNNYAQATLKRIGSEGSGILVRSNGTTGYVVYISTNGILSLDSINGSARVNIGSYTHTAIADGATAVVRVNASGTSFEAFIGGVSVGTKTSSTYTTGSYVGMAFNRSVANADVTVDNFSGGAL